MFEFSQLEVAVQFFAFLGLLVLTVWGVLHFWQKSQSLEKRNAELRLVINKISEEYKERNQVVYDVNWG